MTHSTLRLTSLLLASSGSIAFAAPLPSEPIRDAEQRQEQISTQAKLLVTALDAMLGEYERNHLGGEDAAMVETLRGQLDRLSVAEMRTVVDLLQKARVVQDRGAASQTVADASSVQKRIAVEMERILAAHTKQGEAAELSKRFNELADRQARNLRDGIQLVRMTRGALANSDAVKIAQMEVQRGEQAAIAQEVQLAVERLKKLGGEQHATQVQKMPAPSRSPSTLPNIIWPRVIVLS